MPRKIVIRPYKLGSKAAKLLANRLSQLLGYKVRRVTHNYVPRRDENVINWGNSLPYLKDTEHDSNYSSKEATNKIQTFQKLQEANVSIPEWTTSKEQAVNWVGSGACVLCRKLVSSYSGLGIVVANTVDQVVNAPLYVKYKKKKKEFRAHVIFGQVVEVVEKRKKRDTVQNTMIRNHANGWVFCRDNVVVPPDLREAAVGAVNVLGLQFGAVDLIWNEKENKSYVLEINSAPGIEGQTVNTYANAFVGKYNV